MKPQSGVYESMHAENERLVRAIEKACIEYEKHPEIARTSPVYASLRDAIAEYRGRADDRHIPNRITDNRYA
ncbi:MAG: hypothetical protein ACIAQF_11015 [Phycisphaerales bacterium JB065]